MVFNWRTDRFDSYLMFEPDGGIPVPIKKASWNWYGRAKTTNLKPTGVFVGVLPFVNPTAAVGQDCSNYPQWNTNILSVPWTFQNDWYPMP
jgi:hypothetical protein